MIKNNFDSQNKQKSAYYTNRFDVVQSLPHEELRQKELLEELGGLVKDSYNEAGLDTLWVDSQDILELFTRLKNLGFEVLTEMSAIDFLASRGEFELFYLTLRYENNGRKISRLKIKTTLKSGASIDSLFNLYRSADWAERECYDMFGIVFNGHKDLRRILMPEDWVGYPLQKSYPLKGDENAAWYEVDRIFGRQYREIIGAEQRDSARIDRGDTLNFEQIGLESSAQGIQTISDLQNENLHRFPYQESSRPLFLKNFSKTPKHLDKRR